MLLLLLTGITFIFLMANLALADNDYMHPSVIVCASFLMYETVCIAVKNTYEISFHIQTVMAVTCMLSVFTLITGLMKRHGKNQSECMMNEGRTLRVINVPAVLVIALILLQMVAIVMFVRYLRAIGSAWQSMMYDAAERTAEAVRIFDNGKTGVAALEQKVTDYVGFSVHDIVNSNGSITANIDCIGGICVSGKDVSVPGVDMSLGALINLYDTMTKFWTGIFANLSVPVPFLYRVLNPVCSAASYMLIYVEVNNFMAAKKLNIFNIASIALMCLLIVMNGSRSPLLRIFTAAVILMYVFNVRRHPYTKGNIRTLFGMAAAAAGVGAAMIIVLKIMGRSDKMVGLSEYLFTYVGAPLVNLDNFIAGNDIGLLKGCAQAHGTTELFGAQTFRGLYNYAGKIFGIDKFNYDGISFFAFSNNGIEIGNVYTTLYYPIYDFGYLGIIPVIAIIALYYVGTYRKCINRPSENVIDFRLFIYSYLFNDLIMLTFSNRFFETVLDAPFLKLLLMSFIYDIFIFEGGLRTRKICIRFARRSRRIERTQY